MILGFEHMAVLMGDWRTVQTLPTLAPEWRKLREEYDRRVREAGGVHCPRCQIDTIYYDVMYKAYELFCKAYISLWREEGPEKLHPVLDVLNTDHMELAVKGDCKYTVVR